MFRYIINCDGEGDSVEGFLTGGAASKLIYAAVAFPYSCKK
jgi:hypothetical protein